MQLKMFSVRDSKGEFYGNPIFMQTHGEAERSFAQVTNDAQSTIHQFPEDFDLYYLGEFDNLTGKFKALETPQHVVKAIALKKTIIKDH